MALVGSRAVSYRDQLELLREECVAAVALRDALIGHEGLRTMASWLPTGEDLLVFGSRRYHVREGRLHLDGGIGLDLRPWLAREQSWLHEFPGLTLAQRDLLTISALVRDAYRAGNTSHPAGIVLSLHEPALHCGWGAYLIGLLVDALGYSSSIVGYHSERFGVHALLELEREPVIADFTTGRLYLTSFESLLRGNFGKEIHVATAGRLSLALKDTLAVNPFSMRVPVTASHELVFERAVPPGVPERLVDAIAAPRRVQTHAPLLPRAEPAGAELSDSGEEEVTFTEEPQDFNARQQASAISGATSRGGAALYPSSQSRT